MGTFILFVEFRLAILSAQLPRLIAVSLDTQDLADGNEVRVMEDVTGAFSSNTIVSGYISIVPNLRLI